MMIGKQPPDDDDAAERGISSARVRQLLAEVDAERARPVPDPEPTEPQPLRAAIVERINRPAQAPKPNRFVAAVLAFLRGGDRQPLPTVEPKKKTTFFT